MIKIVKDYKNDVIIDRTAEKLKISETVSDIISNVRRNGDKALLSYAEKFDGAMISNLEVYIKV